MSGSIKKMLSGIFAGIILFSSLIFHAPAALSQIDAYSSSPDLGVEYPAYAGLTGVDVRITVAKVIRVALGLVGIVLTVLILYAGYLWMTAGGNEDKVAEAKQIISRSVIGLIVILAAYALSTFVISRLVAATAAGDSSSIY